MATKLIPVKAIEKMMQSDSIILSERDTELLGLKGYEIVIKDTLDVMDVMRFVANVVENVIDMDSGEYRPELKNFIIQTQILTGYANFRLPADINKQYLFVSNNQGLVKTIISHINIDQYNDIIKSIDDSISYRIKTLSSVLASKINDITSKMFAFSDYSEDMFSKISKEDMSSLITNVTNISSMRNEDIVAAVLDNKE